MHPFEIGQKTRRSAPGTTVPRQLPWRLARVENANIVAQVHMLCMSDVLSLSNATSYIASIFIVIALKMATNYPFVLVCCYCTYDAIYYLNYALRYSTLHIPPLLATLTLFLP